MAGYEGIGSDSAITPDRKTRIEIGLTEAVLNRPPWSVLRRADQIGRVLSSGYGNSINVLYLPKMGWGLKPLQYSNFVEKTAQQAGTLRASNWTLAPHIAEKPHHKAASLTGVTVGADVAATGDYFLHKLPVTGATYNQSLTADASAYPAPTLASNDVPMDRVAVANSNYDENQGFVLRFQVPATQVAGSDNLLTYYWGGPAAAHTASSASFIASASSPTVSNPGGAYAMTIKGNGTGEIFERVGNVWHKLSEITYSAANQVAGKFHQIILSFSKKHAAVITSVAAPAPQGGASLIQSRLQPVPAAPGAAAHVQILRPSKLATPAPAKKTFSGPGAPRLDMRRDQRVLVQVSETRYPASGTLIDAPFVIPFPVAAGTAINVSVKVDTPTGTSVTYVVKDATTKATCSMSGGKYVTNAGQQSYYVEMTLSTSDPKRTPFVKSCEVWVEGTRSVISNTPVTGGKILDVSIMSADSDPRSESASITITDPTDALSILRGRVGHRARIVTQYSAADPSLYSVLMEGEIARNPHERKGNLKTEGFGGLGSPRLYPSFNWHQHDCSMVSVAARLADAVSFQMRDLSRAEDGAADADGNTLPWLITDILRFLLEEAGVHPNDIDIPDLPIRAFTSGEEDEYLLQPTASLIDLAIHFARNYLGGYLIYDANAGTRGMWRLLRPAQPPYTPLWTFKTGAPAGGVPRIVTAPNAHGANSSFVENYVKYWKKPEANYVMVTSTGELLPNDGGPTGVCQFAYNGKSFDFNPSVPTADPNHPDYTDGRFIPIVYYDPTLTTQAACDWVCRALYKASCEAQKWIQFRAPLALVTNPSDTHQTHPRPLRLYDAVEFDGETVLIQSCNIDYTSDRMQMAHYEGLVVLT